MIGLGGLVGFLSGLFGVGGGFLMTPLLMMYGIPPTVAAASDSNQIVAASASGCYTHFRAKTIDVRMGVLMLVGGIAGGTLGVQLIKLLRRLGEADFAITVVYVLMLGGIGSYMFFESLISLRGRPSRAAAPRSPIYRRLVGALPFKAYFPRSKVTITTLMPLLLGSVVGAQIGVHIGRRLRADQLKILMAVLVLGVMVKMLLGLLLRPEFMVAYKGGH